MFKTIFLLIALAFKPCLAIDTTAKQALLYDLETKSIIYEKNADEFMSPSSMSKLMTIYLLFKKLKEGEVQLTDKFKVSKKAWKKGGSRMFLNVNSYVSVEDLIRGIIVQSGNDACITLAEGLSGSEENFVEEMNSLAKELGLINSNFTNSTGWPDEEHLMTSRDLLTLAVRTITDYPEYYHYYAEKQFTYNKIKQFNRNPLIFSELNADGLKTGHTSLGGYGLVASAKKSDRRLILILNGLSSSKKRSEESKRLAQLGFSQFINLNIVGENKIFESLAVWGGNKKSIGIFSKTKINITVPKKIKNDVKFILRYKSPLIAPISKNQKVADFFIKKDKEILKSFELFSNENVSELNFFGKIIQNLKYLIFGETALVK